MIDAFHASISYVKDEKVFVISTYLASSFASKLMPNLERISLLIHQSFLFLFWNIIWSKYVKHLITRNGYWPPAIRLVPCVLWAITVNSTSQNINYIYGRGGRGGEGGRVTSFFDSDLPKNTIFKLRGLCLHWRNDSRLLLFINWFETFVTYSFTFMLEFFSHEFIHNY